MIEKNRLTYLIGIGGAAIIGAAGYFSLFAIAEWMIIALVVAGIAIGVWNIDAKENLVFMVSAAVIALVSGGFSILPMIGGFIEAIVEAIVLVAAPAAVTVALLSIAKFGQ